MIRFIDMHRGWTLIGAVAVALVACSDAQASRVAYQSSDGVVLVSAGGSTARRVASGRHPQVSPDGRWVAFVSLDRTQVRLVPFRGGRQRVVARGARAPLNPRFVRTTWSADSRYVATSEVGNAISVHDTRRRLTRVVRRLPLNGTDIAGLAFSPNGTRIAFSTIGIDEQSLLVVDAKPGAHATVVRRGDGADPGWGTRAGCLAYTLLRGTRYDPAPSEVGLTCPARLSFGAAGSLRAVRWITATRLMAAEAVERGNHDRAVELNTSTGETRVLSQSLLRIVDFSRDGRQVLVLGNRRLAQISLHTPNQTRSELAHDAVTASWSGAA